MTSMEWDKGQEDVEAVDPDEVDAAPPGSADETGGAGDLGSEIGDGESVGTGWTEGGGLPPEGEDEQV